MLKISPAIPVRRRIYNTLIFVLFVIFQLLVIGAAFLGGYMVREWNVADPSQIKGLIPGTQNSFPILAQAYTLLKDNAYFDLPEPKALEYGMIRGMLQAVNEPFTVFVEPPQHKMQTDQLQGKFGGIGVREERDKDNNVFIYPIPGSPAEKAGIKDGDKLIAVGALVITPKISSDDIHAAIRGPVGQPVKVTVGHSPDYAPIELSIERAEVAIPSTTWNLVPDQPKVGIIHIHLIADTTPDEVTRGIKDLQNKGADRFILDVRNNGGGLVDAGVNLARLFLKDGTVIEEQYRGKDVKPFKVEKSGPFVDLPIVVLVNKGTASAAEIFAGSLEGQSRAKLVGTATYGKDTIQLVFSLSDGSSLHVTSAHWWVPGLNQKIGGKGIQPDIAVDETAVDAQFVEKAVEAVKTVK